MPDKNSLFSHCPFPGCVCEQGIFMLVAGFFRLPKDIPKPLWRYPLSYLGFDMYALQVGIKFYSFSLKPVLILFVFEIVFIFLKFFVDFLFLGKIMNSIYKNCLCTSLHKLFR
jgi:hypothetical protein